MGYDYLFRIALPQIKDREELKEWDEPLFYAALDLEKERPWFPSFGKKEHSSAGGYGTGPNEHLEEELRLFGRQFPNLLFYIYFFYWDLTCLTIYSLQGEEVEELAHHNFDGKKLKYGVEVTTAMTLENTFIDNEITGVLTGDDELITVPDREPSSKETSTVSPLVPLGGRLLPLTE